MARKRKNSRRTARRRRGGVGSIITVRKAGVGRPGFGRAGIGRPGIGRFGVRGLGQLPDAGSIVGPLIGGGVVVGTVFLLRHYLSPTSTGVVGKVREYAPLVALGTGFLAATAAKFIADDRVAAGALAGSVGAVAASYATEFLAKRQVASGVAGLRGGRVAIPAQLGAIVPEYGPRPSGTGAIVMQPTASGRRPGSIGNSFGETVSLRGINTSVFGTPGF